MGWLRKSLLLLSAVGVLLSAVGYGVVHFGRDNLEDRVREVVVARTERKIKELVAPRPVETEGVLAAVRNKFVEKAGAAVRNVLGEDYPERLRQRLSELCVCRMSRDDVFGAGEAYERAKVEIRRAIDAAMDRRLDEARLAPGTFRDLIDGYYVSTVEGLVRDLRIFFGLNMALYLLAGVVSWAGGASRIVVSAAAILLFSNLTVGYLHLFDTNWLAKIVFNAWAGYGYLVVVAVMFLYFSYKIGFLLLRIRIARAPLSALAR